MNRFRYPILISLIITLVVLTLYAFENHIKILKTIELDTINLRFFMRGQKNITDNIAIIAIDQESITKIGRWPWKRDKISDMIVLLKEVGAKTVGLDIIFSEPSNLTELDKVKNLQHLVETSKSNIPDTISKELSNLKESFNTDEYFSNI